jgi:Competence protein CoiA-like family
MNIAHCKDGQQSPLATVDAVSLRQASTRRVLTRALSEGRIIAIDQVALIQPPPRRPRCTCFVCERRLFARHYANRQRQDHFAHESHSKCYAADQHGGEGALHISAKLHMMQELRRYISDGGGPLTIPAACVRCRDVMAQVACTLQHGDDVHVEKFREGFKPDVQILRDGTPILVIEVVVTHPCTPEKWQALSEWPAVTLEVDAETIVGDGVSPQWVVTERLDYRVAHRVSDGVACARCQRAIEESQRALEESQRIQREHRQQQRREGAASMAVASPRSPIIAPESASKRLAPITTSGGKPWFHPLHRPYEDPWEKYYEKREVTNRWALYLWNVEQRLLDSEFEWRFFVSREERDGRCVGFRLVTASATTTTTVLKEWRSWEGQNVDALRAAAVQEISRWLSRGPSHLQTIEFLDHVILDGTRSEEDALRSV